MPEPTTSTEIETRDSQILRAANNDSNEWDDTTWAAWFRAAERAHRDGGEKRRPLVDKVGEQQARITELEAELAKYVGNEPTIADEMAYLRRCLNAVHDVCDQAEKQATRWEQPLPVPDWVAIVREAADGVREDDPDDNRRRLYVDGGGNGWISTCVEDGVEHVVPVQPAAVVDESVEEIAAENGGLHEIGRCW
ncbi:hypothetical protein [Streptomyces poriferorum]|uniref:Uncharacterized protein n=1 Tax=Streptomyces poriferorum TaxID=2798799 RepID=A0ABY9IYI4_9ACTN|nr:MULTISPECIES: hypothetical protein [unclassified Streptomyces]MDP5310469.1 hypothetical protein [Streptomyces sp. Alt4]WLQ60377.1 hypothetical protein P8A19_35360 [Streptomyces sp. Alt2]